MLTFHNSYLKSIASMMLPTLGVKTFNINIRLNNKELKHYSSSIKNLFIGFFITTIISYP